jgi:hypothetical protein
MTEDIFNTKLFGLHHGAGLFFSEISERLQFVFCFKNFS